MIFDKLLEAIDSEEWNILKDKVQEFSSLPFREEDSSDIFRRYPHIPPQPRERVLLINELKNRLTIKNVWSLSLWVRL